MADIEIKLEFAPVKKGSTKGTVTARNNGQTLAVEQINLAKPAERKAFVKNLTQKYASLDAEKLEDNLIQIAGQQTKQDQQSSADSDSEQENHPLVKSDKALKKTDPELIEYARQFLSLPDLIERIPGHLHQLGVAGEKELCLMLYLIGTSRLLSRPLAGLVMGASSGGKSYVINNVASMFPEEAILRAHRLSPKALEHMPTGSLIHRFIVSGERSRMQDDAAAEATRALREMIGDGRLSAAVSVQNRPGQWDTAVIQQEGPIAYVESTTLGIRDIFDEDRTRFVMLSVNESLEQTEAVIKELARKAANPGEPDSFDSVVALHHTVQRLLRPLEVIVPFADELRWCLPKEALEVRRSFGHLISYIEAVALLYQYQRQKNEQGRIIAVPQDYEVVKKHLTGPLARSLGCGLTAGAEALLEKVKAISGSFTAGHAAAEAHCSDNTARARIRELVAAGQLELVAEGKGRTPTKYSVVTDPPPLSGLILPELGALQTIKNSSLLSVSIEDKA